MDLQIVQPQRAAPLTVWLRQEQRRKLERMQKRTGLSVSCIVRALVDRMGDVVIVNSVDDLTQEGERDE
jgi:hypothetical protein